MKKKRQMMLFLLVAMCVFGLFFTACNNEKLPELNKSELSSRALNPKFHWTCPECGFLNAAWRNTCTDPACGEKYSTPHANLCLSFMGLISSSIEITTELSGVSDEYHPIELGDGTFPSYLPTAWYEESGPQGLYNEHERLRLTSMFLTDEYWEGFEFGWYRTTRILYPQYHQPVRVESAYTRFMLNNNSLFTGDKGDGIKDGTELAIEAFVYYR